MDSLDAQCLLMHLTLDDPRAAPHEWLHPADGSLVGHFAGSPRTFSWPPEDVARLAERWRELGAPVPAHAADLVRGHSAYLEMIDAGGVPAPDRVLHDLPRREITAFYDEQRLAVVIGDEVEGASDARTAA